MAENKADKQGWEKRPENKADKQGWEKDRKTKLENEVGKQSWVIKLD